MSKAQALGSEGSVDANSGEPLVRLGARSVVGGVLMGLANLVPGISGGTMLLASGVYPRFIRAIAEVSTLRFRRLSLWVLGLVVASAVVSILAFAGAVKGLVVEHRWAMYSLFIGLTLGGVPVVWKMAKPADARLWTGAALGFLVMAVIAVAQAAGGEAAADRSGPLMMFLAGLAGASAMILPGISGGYLLLVLGVYVPILAAIDAFKEALKAGDIGAMMGPGLAVVLPVGVGVVVGVSLVSNLLRALLSRFEKMTLGALLGFLVGAVVGLWPFRRGVAPELGATFKGQVVTPELLAELEPHKYPTEYFSPEPLHLAGAAALIAVGFVATALVAKLGADSNAR